MIEIKVNLTHLDISIDVNSLTNEISSALKQFTGGNINTNVNLKDDNSMSPLGIFMTKDYLKLRDKI